MSRYFVRRGRPIARDWPMLPHLEVSDHEAVDTGLVDERGDPIL